MNVLYYPIIVPLVFGLAILILPKIAKEVFALAGTAIAAYYAGILFFSGQELVATDTWFSLGSVAFSIDLRADALSGFILFASSVITMLVVLFSFGFMKGSGRLKEYYAYLLITSSGAAAAILANNMIVLLVGWEVTTVLLFFLITIGGDNTREGAGKTFVMVGFSDCALLLGIVLLWQMTGTFTVSDIRSLALNSGWLTAAYLLLAASALVKAGAMPGHTWIPKAAESAPASVMAFLPASLDKLLGIYLLVRISCFMFVLTPDISLVLLIIGAATIILAVMMALIQHNLKKLLAFHAVSQVGYMIMGIATGTAVGIIGGLFHMLNNAIYKCCLFMGAGALEKRTGTVELEDLGGLARVMPVTFWSMLIASLAISGVPPFNGFVSKWLIYQGTIEAGRPVFLVAAMFGSALTLASFIKVIHSVFLGKKPERLKEVKSAGWAMGLPMAVLALLSVALGVFAQYPLRHVFGPVVRLDFAGVPAAVNLPLGMWSPTLATVLILAALGAGLLVYVLGARVRVRTTRIFVGGEVFDNEAVRFPGTGFYETIREISLLKVLYNDAEQGVYDIYVLTGRYFSKVIDVLRAIHNGAVSTYLAFALLGLGFLLFFLVM